MYMHWLCGWHHLHLGSPPLWWVPQGDWLSWLQQHKPSWVFTLKIPCCATYAFCSNETAQTIYSRKHSRHLTRRTERKYMPTQALVHGPPGPCDWVIPKHHLSNSVCNCPNQKDQEKTSKQKCKRWRNAATGRRKEISLTYYHIIHFQHFELA